ncbi:MAG: mannose-6-phosphate isomerase, class I [Desulfobacterales bacterium S5133MH4]|nr:MAG: mannose-6-phosphate isomerase, class I [Desulfobacterales bacterium S5133MH4]
MKRIGILKNTIQEYAWGSLTAIPELLGMEAGPGKPRAELWMGAHPKAPSMVKCEGQWRSLLDLIEEDPESVLGKNIAGKFQGKLPYLFKFLAAEKPLSIQAHPSKPEAKAGFRNENELGVPLDSPERNYRDDNHKPELICALTDFWAMCDFRKIPDIISFTKRVCSESLSKELKNLRSQPDSYGLKQFFYALFTLDEHRKKEIIDRAIEKCKTHSGEDQVFGWVVKLSQEHPDDMGALFPLFLNLVCLKPGQAMFLRSGVLHAYLNGVGIELMANSDNVLRGGLTSKHIDVPELLGILDFGERELGIIDAEEKGNDEWVYKSPADEFTLSVVSVKKNDSYTNPAKRSVEIILCTKGEAMIKDTVYDDSMRLAMGTSIIIPAAVKGYRIEGEATLYKAGVPA